VSSEDFERVNVPPDPFRTIEGLRDTGYTLETAIADIIDNSIAAEATEVRVEWKHMADGFPELRVIDNGTGMDRPGLLNAMKYGSDRRSTPSLGKFGLGLKTASSAICKRFSAVSRKASGQPVRKATWDLDEVERSGKWDLLLGLAEPDEIEILDQVANGGSGTLILWQNIDRVLPHENELTNNRAKDNLEDINNQVRSHLSLAFYRFIQGSQFGIRPVRLTFNGRSIEGTDPLCLAETKTISKIDLSLELKRSDGSTTKTARVVAVILPAQDEFSSDEAKKRADVSVENQGFYVYRENRMLFAPQWFRIRRQDNHYSRARVGFFFDSEDDDLFKIDVKKSSLTLNAALRQHLKDKVVSVVCNYCDELVRAKEREKKQNKNVAQIHAASNATIGQVSEEAGIGSTARVTSVDKSKGTASIHNRFGPVEIRIEAIDADLALPNVQPVSQLEDGLLWKPDVNPDHSGIRTLLNEGHAFYVRAFLGQTSDEQVIHALNYFLWALTQAEMNSISSSVKQQFEDMRYEVSRSLRRLAERLPEVTPDTNHVQGDD
jgi:hypothetical protein